MDIISKISTDKIAPLEREKVVLDRFGNAETESGDRCVLTVVDCGLRLNLGFTKDEIGSRGPINWLQWLIYCMLFWANLWLNRLWHRTLRTFKYRCEFRLYIGGGRVVDAYAQALFANRAASARLTNDDFEGFWTGRACFGLEGRDVEYRKFMYIALMTSVRGRRFFVTSNGYIDLAPSATRAEDLVCVLWGCSVPVVFRREGDHYIFVGECYTHGIIDGGGNFAG